MKQQYRYYMNQAKQRRARAIQGELPHSGKRGSPGGMWLYRTSGDARSQIVLYEYQSDRKAEHPKTFLQDFHGYLHADGYSEYHSLSSAITVVDFRAHARRKFDEML